MADFPEGKKEGFSVDVLPEGRLAVSLIVDRKEVGKIEGDGPKAGAFAAQLLTYAKATQEAAGLRLPEVMNPANPFSIRPDLSPSRVEILRNPGETKALMVLTFGQAQISIAIPADFLAEKAPERPDQMH